MAFADHHLRQIPAVPVADHGEQPVVPISAVRLQRDATNDQCGHAILCRTS
jgi:hypothetical protein